MREVPVVACPGGDRLCSASSLVPAQVLTLLAPRLLLTALLALLMVSSIRAQDQQPEGRPLVQVYGQDDYKGEERVWKVLQGESRWLWLLTPKKLHSFDGIRWREIPFPLTSGAHFSMAPLAGGGVVLGSERDLAICAPGPHGALHYASILDNQPALKASLGRTRFLEKIGDRYYFTDSSRFGFFRIHPQTRQAEDLQVWGPREPGTWERPPMFFFQEARGEIWIEFLHKGLGRLGSEGPALVEGGEAFARMPFTGVVELGSSLLIATFTNGLFLFENGKARPWLTEASELCKAGNPAGLIRLDSGSYLLSTRRRGVVLFDAQGKVQQHLDAKTGLPSNSVFNNPGQDHQMGLWIPTSNGVARIQLDSDLMTFDSRDGLHGDILDIEEIQGRIHVLTDQGVFRARGPERAAGEPLFEALPEPRAPPTRLESVGEQLLVGTESGLFSYDPRERNYSELVHLSTRALATSPSKEWIFLGTAGWGLVRLQRRGDKWKVYRPDKPTREVCHRILQDDAEDVWALLANERGTFKIHRYRKDSGYREWEEIPIPKRPVKGKGEVLDIYLHGGTFHALIGRHHFLWSESKDELVGISNKEIPGLDLAGAESRPLNHGGDLRWFVNPKGQIHLYRRGQKEDQQITRPLLRAHDARWNCWLVDEKRSAIWAGNAEGLLVLCRIADSSRSLPPPEKPRFSSISIVDHEPIHGGYGSFSGTKVNVPPEENHFRFAWSLTSFEGHDRILYRTRLVGLEEQWTDWSARAQREFVSLPPGSYDFEVEATDARGRICPRASFTFRILLPWYRSLWASLLVILGAGLIFFGLISWRGRRTQERVHRLESEIAQRETAEQKLEESQRRYRSLVETTSDLVWEMDVDFRYLYASPRFEDQLGYDESELLGRSIFDLIDPVDRDRVRAQLNFSKEAGTPFSGVQFEILEKNGQTRTMESNGVPIFDSEGRLRGFRGIDRDVTDRQAAEDERRELEDRLRQGQKLESLGRLAGGVSHDFNNILTAILGHAEIVRDFCKPGTPMSEGLYTSIEEILRAGRQAADLTGRLLAFSRQQILRPRVVDPGQVLHGLERMLQRLIREDIEIVLLLASDAGRILVDGGQLEQVIINLVVNSVDAMPHGGMLTLRTERVTLDKTHVTLHPGSSEGAYVRISVEDTGQGMDEKVQSRIFEPFFTTKDPGKGTGLGLASTHGIVQQSGGHIQVSSAPGKGTTFELFFPLVTGESEEQSPEEQLHSVAGSERILVCDDDAAIRSVAERSLTAHGYRVRTAADAKETLSLLLKQGGEIDLLVTDLIMPGMNGKELSEQVRIHCPNVPVLFASGYTADIILDETELPPRTDFLPKPFTSQDLLQRIRQLLDH